jgi:hypothetical protein
MRKESALKENEDTFVPANRRFGMRAESVCFYHFLGVIWTIVNITNDPNLYTVDRRLKLRFGHSNFRPERGYYRRYVL